HHWSSELQALEQTVWPSVPFELSSIHDMQSQPNGYSAGLLHMPRWQDSANLDLCISPNASGRTLAYLFLGRGLLRLQPLHENACSPRNMIAAELLCFCSVAGNDGIKDGDMLA